jgi:integrase
MASGMVSYPEMRRRTRSSTSGRVVALPKEHTILAQEQAMAILAHLKEPVRTMAWLDATTGLRVSELLALRWGDIDLDAGVMHVQRGIVYNVVGQSKSDSSKSRMPLATSVLDSLAQWRRETPTLLRKTGSSPAQE